MRLATRTPGHPAALASDFDAFVTRVFGHDLGPAAARSAVDAYETDDALTLAVDLPGYSREQVNVQLDNDVLTLVAERPAPPTPAADDKTVWHLRERRGGRVERSFKLPNTIDATGVDAKLSDGVLTVTLKRRQETKPRKIEIA